MNTPVDMPRPNRNQASATGQDTGTQDVPDQERVARQLIADQMKIIDQTVKAAQVAAAQAQQAAQANLTQNLKEVERMRREWLSSTSVAMPTLPDTPTASATKNP